MKTCLALLMLCMMPRLAHADDPVVTDGDKYKVVFENERVRVLDYRDKPGQKTKPHQHPDAVVYALAPFRRKLILGDGRTVVVEKKAGEVYFVKAQKHVGENIGSTDTHVLIVELKEAATK